MKLSHNYSKDESAFSLVEILVVLAIVGGLVAMMMYGVIKFRQVITVSSASKELVLNLRQVRREALDSVVKERPSAATFQLNLVPDRYFLRLNGSDDYNEGAMYVTTTSIQHFQEDNLKSSQYGGVDVSYCIDVDNGSSWAYILFEQGSGEMGFGPRSAGYNYFVQGGQCKITVSISAGGVVTSRDILVDSATRTIQIDY